MDSPIYITNYVAGILTMLSKAFPNSVAAESALPVTCTVRFHQKRHITSVRSDIINEFAFVVDKKAKLSQCLINYKPSHEDAMGVEV
jgi:hypothetical protein